MAPDTGELIGGGRTADFLLGVVEGFYGRPWPDDLRLAYADYLAGLGLNAMLYCPKGDPFLRKRWQEDWPAHRWAHLQDQSRIYRERGLHWGPGLSPFALYRDYGAAQRSALRSKVSRLMELQPALLGILFDDMPGNIADLASRQADILADVRDWAPGVRLLACPTYYSFDPVLEQHFGARPAGYWEQLGRQLPPDVDIFWTGKEVCAETVTEDCIAAITRLLGRAPLLWDNYPVNDGAVRSRFLYCEAPTGRSPRLRSLLAGHLSNPMNQGMLSLPALSGLAALYTGDTSPEGWLAAALGPDTWAELRSDRELFRSLGLDGLDAERHRALTRKYEALPGAAAAEVAGWLRGEYTFDPACLTD